MRKARRSGLALIYSVIPLESLGYNLLRFHLTLLTPNSLIIRHFE